MSWFAPLWADAEWIGVVIFLIISALSVLGQFLNKAKPQPQGGQPQGQQPPQAGQVRPAGQPVAAGQAAQPPRRAAQDDVADEIADFLRRASQRAQGGPPAAPRQARETRAARETREARAARAGKSTGRQRAARAEVAAEKAVQAEVVAAAPLGSEVGKHVAEHLGGQSFAREASQLGAGVVKAEEQLEQHIHQVFGHRLSTLASRDASLAAPAESGKRPSDLPPTAAAGFAALLSNAASARQAIILHEILTRPEDRWS